MQQKIDQMETDRTIKDKETFALSYFRILKECIFAMLIWKIYQIIESSS